LVEMPVSRRTRAPAAFGRSSPVTSVASTKPLAPAPLLPRWTGAGRRHWGIRAARGTTAHFANLRANPRVALTTGCNRWDQGLDAVVEGEAVIVTDDATLSRVAAAFASGWDGRWQYVARDGAFRHGRVVRVVRARPLVDPAMSATAPPPPPRTTPNAGLQT
jgi:hypothetical protein